MNDCEEEIILFTCTQCGQDLPPGEGGYDDDYYCEPCTNLIQERYDEILREVQGEPVNQFKPHMPAFVDAEEDALKAQPFNTLEELLSLPFVKKFKEYDHQFCLSEDNELMKVKDDGSWWWVVGFLKEPVAGLPLWEQGKAPIHKKD